VQTITEAMQTMITSGRYTNPAARLVCDIDPPFVGVDQLLEGAKDPFFYEYDNMLYMSVVTSAGIVIYSVDLATKGLTQVASVIAANVQNARICYEGSTFYAVWENSVDGKVYYYNGTTTAELADGTCPDILYNSAVYYFWIGADGIYQKTGTTTNKIVEKGDKETFKGLRIFLMPDGYMMPVYVVETAEQDEIRILTPETSEKEVFLDELVQGVDYTSKSMVGTTNSSPPVFNTWGDGTSIRLGNTVVSKALAGYAQGDGTFGGSSELRYNGLNSKYKRFKGQYYGDLVKSANVAAGGIYLTAVGSLFYQTPSQVVNIDVSLSGSIGEISFSMWSGGWIGRYGVFANPRFVYDVPVYKTIHAADKGTLDRLQGSFSGNSVYLSWYQNGVVYGKAFYESEMFTEHQSVDSGDASYIPSMTSDKQNGFVASAIGVYSTDYAYKSFDGNISTSWYYYNNQLTPNYISIKLDKPVIIKAYSLTPRDQGYITYAPVTFELQGSNDNVNWMTIDSQNELRLVDSDPRYASTAWFSGREREFAVATSEGFLYYRLYIETYGIYAHYRGWLAAATCAGIGEFKLYTKDGSFKLYNGASNLGRWTGAAQFCIGYGDGLPVMHVTNSEIDLVVWERGGNLVYGPKILDSPISADCTLSRSMESGSFNADFANDGSFATGALAELFQNEKKIGFELGYNGEFIRKATGQADSDIVKRTQSNIITISAKNKFYDLMQGSITRNYVKTFTIGEKTTVISGYALTGSINDKETVEIRIDALNGKRWIPGSMEIANLTAGFTQITEVYGQTEFFGFVRIRNDSGAAGTPSFDVLAEDCSSLARKAGTKGSVENESKTLTGTTAVRLTQKSVDGTMVVNIAVKNVDGEPYDYNEDEPELGDYILAVDASGYTTLARTAGSAIADGEAVQIDYNYISATSFSMSFSGKTAEKTLVLLNPSAPESYQVVVTGVSGMTINQYYANYRPLHIFVNASVNGGLLQFVLNRSYSGTVTFEVWARPMENERAFGVYPSPADIFKDLAKRAMYKDVKFDEYSGTLEEGQFTSLDTETGDDLFFQIEEGFDPDTLRIENTSMKTSGNVEAISHDVNIHILEAGYILDNDQNYNWGVRLSVTRAAYSGLAIEYSFQIWGQYTARKDFLPPFVLSMPDLPQTNLTTPLRVVDITIEEAARKALQVCFADGRPFNMFVNPRGEWVIKLVKSEAFHHAAHTFQAQNMGSITQKRQSPLVLDRVEIEGAATESFLIQIR
jgi:hypothetical protein